MYVRQACFEGDVPAESRKRFAELVEDGLVPVMKTLPGVLEVRALWGREFECEDRRIHLVLEHCYESLEAITSARESPTRAAVQPVVDEMQALFQGRVYHVNYERAESTSG